MPKAGTCRKRKPRGAEPRAEGSQLPIPFVVPAPQPIRGVKLKTVSRGVMLFALICLAAFVAGRPPVAAGPAQIRDTSDARAYRHRAGSSSVSTIARFRVRAANSRTRRRRD